jgi:hypothetical protein
MDIQHLIEDAKETMLATGSLMPMMHLELSVHFVIVAIDMINDHQSIPVQCGILARLGLETCRKYPDERPVAVAFYSEAWVSESPVNDEQKMRPKLDPKKREVIGVETWQAEGNVCQFHQMPVIRDRKERVVNIGNAEIFEDKMSWQLGSIVQGVKDSQRNDDEIMGTLETAISKRLARMTPERKRQLLEFGGQEGIPLDIIRRFL